MATDFREVLKELKAEELRLVSELDTVRSMIPGAELMAAKSGPVFSAPVAPSYPQTPSGSVRFASYGIKQGITQILKESMTPLMPADITKMLLDGGIQTRSGDFSGNVGSTISQMRVDGLVERVDSGWQLTQLGMRSANA